MFLNGTIMKFGDIVIDKCTVKKETDASTFTGQQNLTFSGDAAALGTCATTNKQVTVIAELHSQKNISEEECLKLLLDFRRKHLCISQVNRI